MSLHDKLDGLGADFTAYDTLSEERIVVDAELHAMRVLPTDQRSDGFQERRKKLQARARSLQTIMRAIYVDMVGFPESGSVRVAKKMWRDAGGRRGWLARSEDPR